MSEQNVLSISNALAISKNGDALRFSKYLWKGLNGAMTISKNPMPIYLLAGRFANTTFNSGRVEEEVREFQIS